MEARTGVACGPDRAQLRREVGRINHEEGSPRDSLSLIVEFWSHSVFR